MDIEDIFPGRGKTFTHWDLVPSARPITEELLNLARYHTDPWYHAEVYVIGQLLAGYGLPERLRRLFLSVTA